MDREKLDEILAAEEELIPSSGFLASVMERVRDEAAAPPPIPFPWKRALPGGLIAAALLGWGAVEAIRHGAEVVRTIPAADGHYFVLPVRPLEQAGWVAMALGVSLISWAVSRRIAGQSGLL